MALVKELTEGSTFAVRGLDLQLFWQLNQLLPGTLVSIADLKINQGEGLFPYLQAPARIALQAAITAHGPLTINSAYRSIAAQTMLYSQHERGLIDNLVAYPGHSDHQKGASVDVEEWEQVIDCMQDHDWSWTYGNADAMHFDCTDEAITDIRPDSIKAFQMLWNKANPKECIPVDGDLGNTTLNCIYNSPAEGFPGVGTPRILKLTNPFQVGSDVGQIQLALRKAGIHLDKADEVFGLSTDLAVSEFQSKNGLTSDGIVGATTRKKLGI